MSSSFDTSQDDARSQARTWTHLKSLSLGLVVLVFVLTILFYVTDIQAKWDSSGLTLVLNIVFVVVPSFFIAFIAARSYVRTGVWSVLWMGIGTVTFGLAAILSNWLRITSANNATTVYAIVALLAGVFHSFAGFFALNMVPPAESHSRQVWTLLQVYLVALAFIIFATVIGGQGRLPPFVISGVGTPIRVMVQVTATVLFLIAGLMLFRQSFRLKSSLLYWYSLGLLLICLSMVGAMLQKTGGSPISWTARSAQYIGGSYLFIAAIVILKEARAKLIPAAEAMADPFSQLKARLKESEARFSAVFERSEIGIAISDMEGRVLESNSSLERILGYTKEELKNRPFTDFTNPDDAALEWSFVQEVIAGKRDHYEIEKRYIRKDGQPIWVRLIGTMVLEEKDTPAFGIALIEDITERKKAEEAFKKSNRKINEILESIQEDFYVLDHDWNFVYASKTFTSRIGKEPEDFVCNNIWQMFPKHIGTVFEENLRLAMDKREIRRFEVGGKYTDAIYRMSVFPSEEGITVLGSDITEQRKAEEANRRQQAEIQTLFENIPAGLVLFDAAPPYKVLVHNGYYQELFAEPFKSSGMAGLNVYQYAPEVEASGVVAVFKEVLQTKQPKSFLDFPYNANPSKETWFNWYMAPIIIEDKVVALVSMTLDVTERHIAGKALKESEERLRTLNETSPVGVGVSSLEGMLLYVNPSYEQILGYDHDQLIGKKASDLYWEPEARRSWVSTMEVNGVVRNVEVRLKRKDGIPIWVSINVSPILFAGKQAVIGTIHDITERKKAEEELESLARESAETLSELQAVLDTAPFAIWIARDPECRKITGNIYANELFGVIQGDNISRSALPGEAAIRYRVLRNKTEVKPENLPAQEAARTGKIVIPWEMDLVFEDGRVLHMLIGAVPLLGADGQVRGSVAVGANITEQKQAMMMKDDFIGMVSHEIRTPLTVTIGALGTAMTDGISSEDARQLLHDAMDGAESMDQIVSNLLELSRSQSDRLTLHKESIDIGTAIRRAVEKERSRSDTTRW
jgi:PAS domain S-box-containing protein